MKLNHYQISGNYINAGLEKAKRMMTMRDAQTNKMMRSIA